MSPYTFEYIIDHICSIGNVVAAIQTTIPKKKQKKKNSSRVFRYTTPLYCRISHRIQYIIGFDENFALTLDSIAPRSSQPLLSPPASFRHSSWPSQYGIWRRRSSTAHVSEYCGGESLNRIAATIYRFRSPSFSF